MALTIRSCAGITGFSPSFRTGISSEALEVIAAAVDILFLSCNQHRLAESLVVLAPTHTVATVAYMDHFPYSLQSECGVHLVRRRDHPAVSGVCSS